MNYTTWFHPSVSILHPDSTLGEQPDSKTDAHRPINHGDLLHVDFGVTALGLNTDIQHLAYVLPPGAGESNIPQGYLDGLKVANLLQDIVRWAMRPDVKGKTGNDVLAECHAYMKAAGFNGSVYSHPIGDWGHSAGSLIGMTNFQDGVPVLGELPMLKNSYYSVELYAEHFVPERNATMKLFLEEDVYWDDENEIWQWVYGRQEKFHFIRSPASASSLRTQEL